MAALNDFIKWCVKWMYWRPGSPATASPRPAVEQRLDRVKSPATAAPEKPGQQIVRPSHTIEVTCRLIGTVKDNPWPAKVRDITGGGAALVVARRFEPGTLLAFELENKNLDYSRTMVAKVVQITPQAGGNWILGCVFATKLSDEELQTLV